MSRKSDDIYRDIEEICEQFKTDANKYANGRITYAQKARVASSKLSNLLKEYRKATLDETKKSS